jgi:hypothetical protein
MMANNPFFSDTAISGSSGALATITALLNSGDIKIYTGSQPTDANQSITGTLLATLVFGATAFGTPAASGAAGSRVVTATANAITSGTAGNTGTAGYFVLEKSDGATVIAMGSVGTSGADLNLNSLSVTSGATVSCSSFTITQTE